MRALVSPRTPRSHHPGCPLLLPATRPDLQAEHPAAPSAELGGGTGAAERGCVRRGGTNGAAAPPRCHYNSAAPEQECAAGALEPNYPNYVDLPSRCELCRRRPRAATRTNVCLSCKKGAGAFLPPYSPQQPYFGNEKSLLSHPDITCGAQRRRGRVTDGDHTAMDAHRSQQGPMRGSARTICLCVPLLGSPRPPQRRLPSFPSTALGQLRSPSHQLGSIGSQRIPGSKPSWRSTEPTGRAFTAPIPAAHPEQSFGGTPPPSPRFSAPRPRVTAKQLLRPTTQLQRQPPPFPRGSNSHRTRQANQPGLPSLLPGPTCRGGLPLPAARRGSPALLCSTPAQGTPPEPHGSLSAQRPPHPQPQPRGRIDCKGWNSEPR